MWNNFVNFHHIRSSYLLFKSHWKLLKRTWMNPGSCGCLSSVSLISFIFYIMHTSHNSNVQFTKFWQLTCSFPMFFNDWLIDDWFRLLPPNHKFSLESTILILPLGCNIVHNNKYKPDLAKNSHILLDVSFSH